MDRPVKVVAQSGAAFLLEVADGVGRVLDTEQRCLFPPNAVASILARGYWEPFDGDPAEVERRLREARDMIEGTEGELDITSRPVVKR